MMITADEILYVRGKSKNYQLITLIMLATLHEEREYIIPVSEKRSLIFRTISRLNRNCWYFKAQNTGRSELV